GLSSEVIWVTTSHIQQSDLFHHEILVALGEYGLFIVIVSKEFVSGKRRLEQRIAILKVVDEQRIFLVDMESVAEYKLPAMLRKIKPVQFYEKDRTYASKLSRAALDQCRLADTELDAVTGGFGEVFLTAVLPTVDGHVSLVLHMVS